jgi:hypothetical protein
LRRSTSRRTRPDRRCLADAADRSLWESGRDIALELDMSEKHLIAAREISVQ